MGHRALGVVRVVLWKNVYFSGAGTGAVVRQLGWRLEGGSVVELTEYICSRAFTLRLSGDLTSQQYRNLILIHPLMNATSTSFLEAVAVKNPHHLPHFFLPILVKSNALAINKHYLQLPCPELQLVLLRGLLSSASCCDCLLSRLTTILPTDTMEPVHTFLKPIASTLCLADYAKLSRYF